MTKHVRRLVVSIERRPNDGPTKDIWPECGTAILECGHRINMGVCIYRHKRMACTECGPLQPRRKMIGNTYGKNRFREVRVRCANCNGTQTTNMQCDVGSYQWECELCDDTTAHVVTEVTPNPSQPEGEA